MSYKKDKVIEASAWIVMSFILYKFVPRNKFREAQLAFLFKQVITWIFGLIVVENGIIKYPHRLFFKKANKASFTFEFFILPSFCSLFNIHYPEQKHQIFKVLHYVFYTSIIVILEIYAIKSTNLIKYKKWTWYWSYITITISYYLSRLYYRWFFRYNNNQPIMKI
ncbi:CBO0543 family protein [Anaerobacillus alkalilacustris]|nr:CBO0543 family protein [Anaerobacillus alkalilacustris]